MTFFLGWGAHSTEEAHSTALYENSAASDVTKPHI